jgi:hypothetical protein
LAFAAWESRARVGGGARWASEGRQGLRFRLRGGSPGGFGTLARKSPRTIVPLSANEERWESADGVQARIQNGQLALGTDAAAVAPRWQMPVCDRHKPPTTPPALVRGLRGRRRECRECPRPGKNGGWRRVEFVVWAMTEVRKTNSPERGLSDRRRTRRSGAVRRWRYAAKA